MKLQIIDYDIIKDEDESKEENQPLRTEKSQESQKSYNEMINSKFEAVPESCDETPLEIQTDNHLKEAGKHADGIELSKNNQNEDTLDSESDVLDQDFLDQFDNENTTQELSLLYTSCFEWILSRPVKGLNS